MNKKIDEAGNVEIGRNAFDELVDKNFKILTLEIKNIGWEVAGGLDQISAAQIKRAPPRVRQGISLFQRMGDGSMYVPPVLPPRQSKIHPQTGR